jgi:putative YhbY family RNA-binding protein
MKSAKRAAATGKVSTPRKNPARNAVTPRARPLRAAPAKPKPKVEVAPYVHGPAPVLTPAERQSLKGEAHGQQPVAMIGSKGLTDAVLAEIDIQLNQHGLIKIKAATDERGDREAWLNEMCEKLQAAPVQHIGKVLLIFRPKPPEPLAEPPPKKVRPADKPTPQQRRMEAAGISENVGRARVGRDGAKVPGYKTSDRRGGGAGAGHAGTPRSGGAYGANTRRAQEYKKQAYAASHSREDGEVDATTAPPRSRPRPPPRAGGFQAAGARTRRRNTG